MTRQKKSRNPGVGSSGPVKTEKKKEAPVKDKKPKNVSGKKPGNRQTEARDNSQRPVGTLQKDPRIGSKKPIVLVKTPEKVAVKKSKPAPMAAIRVLAATDDLAKELAAIEQDETLQDIIAKQDDDMLLTEQQVSYFNEKMARHQELSIALGLDDNSESVQASKRKTSLSEDELWDKFNHSDFSDH